MSFQDILNKIEQEAQRRQKAIIQNAQLEAEKILEKAKIEMNQESDRLVLQRTKESQLLVQRMLAEAKLKGKGMIGCLSKSKIRSYCCFFRKSFAISKKMVHQNYFKSFNIEG